MALLSRETYFMNLPWLEPEASFQHTPPTDEPDPVNLSDHSAWEFADRMARLTQWRWALADAAIMNFDAVPKSGDKTGTGGSGATYPVAKQP